MLLGKAFFVAVLSQALTVFSSPILTDDNSLGPRKVEHDVLSMRASNPYTALADTAQWTRYKKYRVATTKRYIEDRAILPHAFADTVNMDAYKSVAKPTDAIHMGLFTQQLSTCMAVVVTGTSTAGNTRHMLHLPSDEASLAGSTWAEFLASVKEAKLKDMKVYLRVPDLKNDLPKTSEGAPLNWSATDAALAAKIQPLFLKQVETALGATPKVVTSPMGAVFRAEGEAGTMEVSGLTVAETKVYIDGIVVS